MNFHDLFNITVAMTPRRTFIACALVAAFFALAAALYDASVMVDAPMRAWVGMR